MRRRKVNAAATAAEHGEKCFSALTQAALRVHGKSHIVKGLRETKATSYVYFQLAIYGHACFALKHVWPHRPLGLLRVMINCMYMLGMMPC